MAQKISLQLIIPSEWTNQRLDKTLASLLPDYSRSQVQYWINQGYVSVDQKPILATRYKVKTDQLINVEASIKENKTWQAQEIPLDIIFEDDELLVINKPAGLVVHPGAGNPDQTLLNALLHHAPTLSQLQRAGIVHRLDKQTSGLLVIAKTPASYQALVEALQNREIHRIYRAIVKGVMTGGGKVEASIGRHPKQRTQMAVHPQGKLATTHYRVLKRFNFHTYIKLELESGRTHQIRVHMTYIRHPLVGDPVYGKRMNPPGKISIELRQTLQEFKRQALHATRLEFLHPITHEPLQFEAPLPKDIQCLLVALEKNNLTQ